MLIDGGKKAGEKERVRKNKRGGNGFRVWVLRRIGPHTNNAGST